MLEFMPTVRGVVKYSNVQGLCLCRVKVHLGGAAPRDVALRLLSAQPSLKSLDRSALAFVLLDLATSDRGSEHWAIITSLVETYKLCGVDPQAYLADVLSRIVTGHLNTRIDDLLPWAYAATPDLKAVA
jgi:hypothetical protein